jgi:glucokinase
MRQKVFYRSVHMILVGEIGATNSHLAIFEHEQNNFDKPKFKATKQSQAYPSLENLISEFLQEAKTKEPIFNACFGMAGFVDEVNQTCQISNSKWPLITENHLQQQDLLSRASISLLNDVKAMGFGISKLTEEDVIEINSNSYPKEGDRALIYAPGPGLGAARLYSDFGSFVPLASEVGHAGIAAPSSDEKDKKNLLEYLHKISSHISSEQLLSWSGFVNIYQFFAKDNKLTTDQTDEELAKDILAKNDASCQNALKLFASIFGAEAGNIALSFLASDGIYISGELALATLGKSPEYQNIFMEAFTAKEEKGGEQKWCEHNSNIPVKIINRTDMVLLGAYVRAQPVI